MTRLFDARSHAKAGIDSLPMPGGGFGYYHHRTGMANWKIDWRESWLALDDRLYRRYEELLDSFGEKRTYNRGHHHECERYHSPANARDRMCSDSRCEMPPRE